MTDLLMNQTKYRERFKRLTFCQDNARIQAMRFHMMDTIGHINFQKG